MEGKNFNYYMSSVAPLENKQLGPVTIKWHRVVDSDSLLGN